MLVRSTPNSSSASRMPVELVMMRHVIRSRLPPKWRHAHVWYDHCQLPISRAPGDPLTNRSEGTASIDSAKEPVARQTSPDRLRGALDPVGAVPVSLGARPLGSENSH